jgi:DNA-binding CsgD family transcriptional regulator
MTSDLQAIAIEQRWCQSCPSGNLPTAGPVPWLGGPALMRPPGWRELTLDEGLQITSRTAASQSWLDALLPPGPQGHAIPASVYNVAAQLLAVEAGIDDRPASTRVHLSDGFWLTLRAARLASDPPESDSLTPGSGSGPGNIVVTIEEASATERMDLFSRAVGLTSREYELLGWLATGSDTRAMARQMSLSEHTIQDHLKSIFTKTGSRDRVSVMSRALGTKSDPPERQRSDVGRRR